MGVEDVIGGLLGVRRVNEWRNGRNDRRSAEVE